MKAFITILSTILISLHSFGACTPGSGLLTPIKVDSVSVQSNGDILICWKASADIDISKYYIIHKNPLTNANDVIDSVLVGVNCYTILAVNNNSSINSEEYAIGVKDLCDNSNFVNLDYHNTIFSEKGVDICSASILLNWSAYEDFQSGLNVSYNVFASENGGAYTLVGATNQLSITFSGVQQGFTYDIFIQAVENGGVGPFSSSSNYIHVNTLLFLINPNYLYLYSASVVDSTETGIVFYADTAADIKEYEILRANSVSANFTTIGRVPAFKGMSPLLQFSDYNVNANQQSYVYKVNSINLCGDLKITSNIGKTILLSVEADQLGATNTLTMSNYENWEGGVLNYEIYRAVNGVWELSPIAVLPPFNGTVTHIDNVSDITIGNGEFCYKIVANENTFMHVGNLTEATSTSNESCVYHEPILFVPNAFDPLSAFNPIFKPVLTFPETNTYLFSIYDRWGSKVYETKIVDEGWNGSINNSGKLCPAGTYVYSITFRSTLDEEFHKRGKVTLLR